MEDTIQNYIDLAKMELFLPNHRSRKIRLSDLGYLNETSGDLRYSLISNGGHAGIASYTYLGDLGDAIVDPGIGNCGTTTEEDDDFGMQLVISRTDKNGLDVFWSIVWTIFMFGFLEYCTAIIYVHSKSDPKRYMGLYVFDLDAITDDDDDLVGFVFNVFPMMASMTYDAGTDEYTEVEIPDNDEVLMSWDFSFNPEYLGSMGTQDSDSVSINGGTISATNIYGGTIMTLPVKETTGDPEWPNIGQIYVNTFDKLVRIYVSDDDWRTILDFG